MEPPPLEGAVKDTTDWPLAFEVAETPVGAPGTSMMLNEPEALDAEPVPDAFVAVTVQVYAWPGASAWVSAETVIGELAALPVFVAPPELEQVAV